MRGLKMGKKRTRKMLVKSKLRRGLFKTRHKMNTNNNTRTFTMYYYTTTLSFGL